MISSCPEHRLIHILHVHLLLLWALMPAFGQTAADSPGSDWPMLAHDCARSGATTTEIRPPFERKWYRLFPDEGLMAGVQPVIAGGRVFIGTMRGTLRAIDCDTGEDAWIHRADGAILHACAVGDGKVVFGDMSGRICALNAEDGKLAWHFQTGAAVWNAPLIYQGIVVIGSRDGSLYALDLGTGSVKWKGATGGPLLSSPALDSARDRVYVAGENMRVHAFDFAGGRRIWQSPKLPGVSFRGYHPVIAPDGSVMVTTTPAICLDSFEPVLMGMVKEIFGDFASWRHTKEENAKLREANFKKMGEPGSYEAQLCYIRKKLTEEPIYQTFFVLDPDTGRQKFVAPIVYAESMNGTGAPPVVTTDGKVIVRYQALLRCRYEHYSPFLNVGYLDTTTGHITPIMDQSRTYGWHDSLLLVHDEQCQLSVAGRVLINTHQDNVNAMDLDTLQGYAQPFCRNIHEPAPGEAVGIWAMVFRGEPLPLGKEWLARGTAVYGGGSVIDTAVSVAGDSFYYIPTHEMNASAALIAYRMSPNGKADRESNPPLAKLTGEEWAKMQERPWDWDILGFRRLRHVLEALPGKVPGTVHDPLTPKATERVSEITDSELDPFIRQARMVEFAGQSDLDGLRAKLATQVRELISQPWQPLLFPPGKHPREAYRIFADPTETLLTLARTYPHVDQNLQKNIRRYVKHLRGPGGPLEGPTGKRTVEPSAGAIRSYYDIAPDKLFRLADDITRTDVARLYPLWLWAQVTNDWEHIESNWAQLKTFADQAPNKMGEDCRNGYLAGLIAYCRIAARLQDKEAVEKGLSITRKALRGRLAYEFAHTRGGLIAEVPVLRSICSRWRHLTPEVGRFLAHYAGRTQKHLMDVYVDYHRPTWHLAWGVETMWRNESPFAFPTMAAEIFAARAWVLNESADELQRLLDIPWCRADLFYMQKLVSCIEAHGRMNWQSIPPGGVATGRPEVPGEVMQHIYDEVKTPYKYGVILVGDDGAKVDCPGVFRHGDQWYMTYIIFAGTGYETALAQSADLLHWKPLGKILRFREGTWDARQAAGFIALQDPVWGGSGSLGTHDNKYWLSYIGGALEGYETDPLAIGMAWTNDPARATEWNRLDEPILSRDQPDVREFETVTLYKSNIIRDEAEMLGYPFVMFYNGKRGNGHECIGMAVSKDMTHWLRFGRGPVIDNGKGISGDPQLTRIGDVWVMHYFGAFWKPKAFDTFACSYDLAHWTKWDGPHLIEPSEPWDKTFAHKPWVIKHNDIVYHFYCAVGDRGRVIALATSKPLPRQD